MDGVIAMEGNGPASGTPTNMNVILMSTDPVALDTVFCKLIYLNPEYVPTCVIGEKNGLGTMDINEIEILTEDGILDISSVLNMYGNPKFDVTREERKFWKMPIIGPVINKILGAKNDRPVVDENLCIGCGICEKACPVPGKAVHSGNGNKAKYDYKKCIRCYCCQEMCPKKAIHKK